MLRQKHQTATQSSCWIRSHIYLPAVGEDTWSWGWSLQTGTWFTSRESRQRREAGRGWYSFIAWSSIAHGREHGNKVPTEWGRIVHDGSILEKERQPMTGCLCQKIQTSSPLHQKEVLLGYMGLCLGHSQYPRCWKATSPTVHCPNYIHIRRDEGLPF